MWSEDFQLVSDLGLGLPQIDCQFGDLESKGRILSGENVSLQPQGVIEPLETLDNDCLGMEWMESSDWMENFLGGLGDYQPVLPLESSLQEIIYVESSDLNEPISFLTPEEATPFQQKSLLGTTIGVVDPSSQVDDSRQSVPLVKVEPVSPPNQMTVTPPSPESLLGDNDFSVENFTLSELDILHFDDTAVRSMVDIQLSSPISVEDVESTLSFSNPSSPENNLTQIIETSPELYKVIASYNSNKVSPSLDHKVGSPYDMTHVKETGKKNNSLKAPRKTRRPAQPVPDFIIQEHTDKKFRKKLQNKNAAIRYRMKKKEEAQGIVGEERELEDKNEMLKTKVEDLEREIKTLKTLMADVQRVRGIQI